MKKIILSSLLTLIGFSLWGQAQTANANVKTSSVSNVRKNLIGKWKCVRYNDIQGKEVPLKTLFKTDSIIQIFFETGEYESTVGNNPLIKGKWKLINNNKEILIDINGLGSVKVKLQKIDSKKRITYEDKIGKFEYQKM